MPSPRKSNPALILIGIVVVLGVLNWPRPLPADGFATSLSSQTFSNAVLNAEGVVVVDFWAAYCGPCRKLAPMLESLAEEFDGRLKVYKVDIKKYPSLAQTYEVSAIPCVYLFKDGKALESTVGLKPKSLYREWFEAHL